MSKQAPIAIQLALPGAASHIVTVAGFTLGLADYAVFKALAGASAGALIALLVAFGRIDILAELMHHWLKHNRLLDVVPDGRIGICAWNKIPEIVIDTIGRRRLGAAMVPVTIVVTDADRAADGLPCADYISSETHPNVLVHELARGASALVPMAPMVTIPSLGTARSPSVALKYDGGFVDNLPDHRLDGGLEPIVSLGLTPKPKLTGKPTRIDSTDALGQAKSIIGAMTFLASEPKTKRKDSVHVIATAHGSGLDFDLSHDEIVARLAAGHLAALDARPRIEALRR